MECLVPYTALGRCLIKVTLSHIPLPSREKTATRAINKHKTRRKESSTKGTSSWRPWMPTWSTVSSGSLWGFLNRGGSRTELPFQRKSIFGFQKRGRRWEEGSQDSLLATELQLHSTSSPTPEATSCSGYLPCCFKACFLPAHGLFHRATCAWPPGIRRLSPANYEHLAVPTNQSAAGGRGCRRLCPGLPPCPGKKPSSFSEAVEGRGRKAAGLSFLGLAVPPGNLLSGRSTAWSPIDTQNHKKTRAQFRLTDSMLLESAALLPNKPATWNSEVHWL